MSDYFANTRVVIIGGGVVGASCLYHLALAGCKDCLLLERNELTAGSTWHAAGNVPTFSSNWAIMNMQRYSTELYRSLAQSSDNPISYHVSGSLRLGHNRERALEFQMVEAMARQQGMEMHILSPHEAVDKYPFLETHDLSSVLYDPVDGDIDPAQLTQALAAAARALGARIERFCPVNAIESIGDEWLVHSDKGDIRCQYIVNAAGYYAGRVAAMLGRRLPMAVMSHQYVLFENVPEVEAWSRAANAKLPLLRDVDSSYYLRQEKYGFNLGPYERNCRTHWDDAVPEDFSFQLFPDDLERIEWQLNDASERVPLLQQAGLSKVINGPIPYTPDGNPLIGPMPGVPNAFEACVFTFGICQAGGAGKVLAEWLLKGETEWDMFACDPRRFGDFCSAPSYARGKAMEVYGHEYGIHFPYRVWPAGREQKLSPLHAQLQQLGAQFDSYNGWERANWFAQAGDDTSEETGHRWERAGPWEPRVQAECETVRDEVGVLDLTGFGRFSVSGAGAEDWLLGLVTGKLPRVGRLGLIYFANSSGGIVSELSVLRHSQDSFTLIGAAAAELYDYELLRAALPTSGEVSLANHSADYGTLLVTGPKARELLAPLSSADLQLPWLSLQAATVAGHEVTLVRVSFVGELGWEIHAVSEHLADIYAAVLQAGARPFGMWALNRLRLEKGYRAWGLELSSDYNLFELGLERYFAPDKAQNFSGKQALLELQQQPVARRCVTLSIVDSPYDPTYMSNVYSGDKLVGAVSSGGYGYRVNSGVALAMIASEHCQADSELEVEMFGKRYPARVHANSCLWDATNDRIRA